MARYDLLYNRHSGSGARKWNTRFGTFGRNTLIGPGSQIWDLAFIERNKITDRLTTEFRGGLFNAFNHTNFGKPGTTIGTRTAAIISSSSAPRDI